MLSGAKNRIRWAMVVRPIWSSHSQNALLKGAHVRDEPGVLGGGHHLLELGDGPRPSGSCPNSTGWPSRCASHPSGWLPCPGTRPWPRSSATSFPRPSSPGRPSRPGRRLACLTPTRFYWGQLFAIWLHTLTSDTAAADRHYRVAAGCHRRLGARPMLAHTLYEHAQLLRQQEEHAALAEARAIAADCGMIRLLAVLDRPARRTSQEASSPCTARTISGSSLRGRRYAGNRTA